MSQENDKELLVLAAKAAGYEINFDEPVNGYYPNGYDENGDVIEWWNPLIRDGQALRLAVKLDLSVYSYSKLHHGGLDHFSCDNYSGEHEATEYFDNQDKYSATRRAIVRVAASIGKEMP